MKKQAKTLYSYHESKYDQYSVERPQATYLEKVFSLIRTLSSKKKISKALDIGCTDGGFAARLKKAFGFDMYGLDMAEGSIASCKEKGVKGIVHNLEQPMPIEDDTFDLITLCEVIEHIFDTDFLLSEIKRILKPGGVFIITTPNIASLTNRLTMLIGKYPTSAEYRASGSGHIRIYTFSALINQMKEHGFLIKQVTSPNFPFPIRTVPVPAFMKKILINLGDVVPRFSNQIVLVATKT
ncbi:MAG: class I SAM-dependent methyltransferase [Nanoarchaeota archaeon]|nr:class I SAM-dependent methyltransferase [Nanoarchaeota archaeon]